jgi:hypothetical protein
MYEQAYFTFFDRTGAKLITATDVMNATWIRTVNSIGSAVIELDATAFDFMTYTQEDLGLMIEVVNDGRLTPDLETFWFLRGFNESRRNDLEVLTLEFEDAISLLNRRIVSLKANNPDGSEPRTELSGPGNVIMAEIFETVTSLASFSRNWSANVSVAPIAVPSPTVEKDVPWKVLLQVLQQICRTSRDKGTPLYFDMIHVPPYSFRFTTYVGQRARARSEPINSKNPLFILDNFSADYNVPNTGYVGGAGRGDSRRLGFAQQPVVGTFGIFERFKSTNVSSQPALDDEARSLVNGASGKFTLSGKLLGDLANRYNWGDRVTVTHRNFLIDCEISTIRSTITNKVLERDIRVKSIE